MQATPIVSVIVLLSIAFLFAHYSERNFLRKEENCKTVFSYFI